MLSFVKIQEPVGFFAVDHVESDRLLVQFLNMVDDRIIHYRLNGHINICNVGDNRSDAQSLEIKIGTAPHTSADQDVAVPDVIKHFFV